MTRKYTRRVPLVLTETQIKSQNFNWNTKLLRAVNGQLDHIMKTESDNDLTIAKLMISSYLKKREKK